MKDRAAFSALFRRVSPCVRFVTESRVEYPTEDVCAVSAIFERRENENKE